MKEQTNTFFLGLSCYVFVFGLLFSDSGEIWKVYDDYVGVLASRNPSTVFLGSSIKVWRSVSTCTITIKKVLYTCGSCTLYKQYKASSSCAITLN